MSIIFSVLKGNDKPWQSKSKLKGGGHVQEETGGGVVWLPTVGFRFREHF